MYERYFKDLVITFMLYYI